MKIICAWCKKVMEDGPPPITHGICELCIEKVLEENKEEVKIGK